MQELLLVGSGGFLGAISRFLVSKYTAGWLGSFPIGTLLVNFAGSLLLGVIMTLVLHDSKIISADMRAFFAVGFAGAFTTMSTFAYESYRLAGLRDYMLFTFNIVGTLVLCLLAVYLGRGLANVILGIAK